jgi:hypothetical protein
MMKMKYGFCNAYDEKYGKPRSISMQNSVRKRLSYMETRYGNLFKLAVFTVFLMLLCLLTGFAIAQISQRSVASYGMVKVMGVSLFWDRACTSDVTSIDWGTVVPGGSVDKYLYVRNNGTTAGTLSISCSDFVPETAASYMTLVWNCSGYVLSRDSVICAKLTLLVRSNITGVSDFSFGILVQSTA